MDVLLLGAHCRETPTARMSSLLVDGVLALDAGALTSTLPLKAQEALGALLLTHRHYDHVRDLPVLALNTLFCGATLPVYALPDTHLHLQSHLLDGSIYPNFTLRPSVERPRLRLVPVEPLRPFPLLGYEVVAVPVPHTVPAVGYQVRGPDGSCLFFTGDAGPGLASAWAHTSPDLLLVEATFPSRMEERARTAGHLTPRLLQGELEALARQRGSLPRVVALHLSPEWEEELWEELPQVGKALGAEVQVATQGLLLRV